MEVKMVRLVIVLAPQKHWITVWRVLKSLLSERDIYHLVSVRNHKYAGQWVEMRFKTKDSHLQRVLEALEKVGCGVDWGHVDVVALVLSKPAISSLSLYYTHRHQQSGSNMMVNELFDTFDSTPYVMHDSVNYFDGLEMTIRNPTNLNQFDSADISPTEERSERPSSPHPNTSRREELTLPSTVLPPRRKYVISDRMTIDEIASFVDEGSRLTFNYLALVTCASIMAGVGLLTDSATIVIASMLVSPLLGPILSITFGLAVSCKPMVYKGCRNEFIGVCISFFSGMLIGFIASKLYSPHHESYEMYSRGEESGLVAGLIVAMASGMAVVLGITTGGINAIVGTAISVSLLPPIVNSGICLALSIIYSHATDPLMTEEHSSELLSYAQVCHIISIFSLMNMELIFLLNDPDFILSVSCEFHSNCYNWIRYVQVY